MKLVGEVCVAEVHGTRMITGDSEIPWRSAHSAITSPKVRLSRKPVQCAKPASAGPTNAFAGVEMRRIWVIEGAEAMEVHLRPTCRRSLSSWRGRADARAP